MIIFKKGYLIRFYRRDNEIMFCKNCGANIKDGALFCTNCGTKVNVAPAAQPQVQPQMQPQIQQSIQPQMQQPVLPQMQQSRSPKKKGYGAVIGILSALLVTVLLVGVLVYFFTDDNDKEKDDKGKTTTKTEKTVDDADLADQTVMIYIIGSDLEEESACASEDILELIDADIAEGTNVVFQTGGCKKWWNDTIKDNTVQRFYLENDDLVEIEDLGKISMVEEDTLSDFITFASENYPAKEYVLVLWNHGGGIPIGFGYDSLFPDDTLDDYELGNALEAAGVHFDSVIFDACNMGTLEVGLALKDYADYMIGAESYVNGIGLGYSNWITVLSNNGASEGSYREKVVSDYMIACDDYGMVASMSVIDLSRLDAVYTAYADYLGELKDDLEDGMYAEITKARGDCGEFEGTDSVDLVTLANKYENSYSTALINAVVNAVSYTESDFANGHGITAYSPYSYLDDYTYGRQSFEELSYAEQITGFYDEYMTLRYSYVYGQDAAQTYGDTWYDESIIELYAGNGVTISEASEYTLEYTVEDGNIVFDLSDIDYYMVTATMFIEDTDGSQGYLGEDAYYIWYDVDSYKLLASNPTSWVCINDYFASFVLSDLYSNSDTDEWYQYGYVYAVVNGEGALLQLYYDQDNPYGMVLGYYSYDFDTMERMSDTSYSLKDDDVIQLAMYYYENQELVPYYIGEEFNYSDLDLAFYEIDLENEVTYITYNVYDVYGNEYHSREFCFTNGELQY